MTDKIAYRIWDWLGWHLCEIAFRYWRWRGEKRARLSWLMYACHTLGSRCYGRGTKAALKCGALMPNPRFGEDNMQPKYMWADER